MISSFSSFQKQSYGYEFWQHLFFSGFARSKSNLGLQIPAPISSEMVRSLATQDQVMFLKIIASLSLGLHASANANNDLRDPKEDNLLKRYVQYSRTTSQPRPINQIVQPNVCWKFMLKSDR